MKTATRQYKAQMQKQLRNRSRIGITFGNIDVSASSDGDWAGYALPWSSTATLDVNHDYTYNVATLELNRWHLDGSQVVLPDLDVNCGFVGSEMSDENGDISFYMIRSFSYPHALSGMTITFDSMTGEWPISGLLRFEDENMVMIEQAMTPDSATEEVQLAMENAILATIQISKMIPYRRPRFLTTIWGIGYSYGNEDIVGCTESNDVDPLSRRLPREKFSFTAIDYDHRFDPDNPEGIYSTINRGAPISVSYGYELDDGTVEWLATDTYALDNKPTFANSQVTFTGIGLLATMTNSYYKGILGTVSFYDLAEDVLQDANLSPSPSGSDPWDIDDSLRTMYTSAPMPIQSHAACLQMIAHACNCRLFTDDQNVIHIEPFGVTPAGVFSGAFTDNGHAWISSWDSVDYGVNTEATYATLELNRWILGTPQTIADANALVPKGYVSSDIGDSSGAIDATWTKTFDISHDVPMVVITFDDVLGEYPDELTVTYYDEDGVSLGSETVQPDGSTFTIDSEVEDCKYFTVAVSKMKIPYRRSRVTKTAYFETDFSLTLDSVKQDAEMTTKLDRLRNVTVAEYSYTSSDSSTVKLYEATTDETSIHVEFQMASDIQITVTGGSVVSSSVYAQAADIELTAGTKTVLIEGVTLNEGSVIRTYTFGLSGEDDAEENKLITNKTMADAHAAHVGAYLALRNTYDADYRGNPELEVGDLISVQTPYDNVVYGIVLIDETSFNGALSGKIKVKGLV